MKILLGISGRARSGKNTIAEIIQELVPDSKVWAWADLVKETAAASLGLDKDHFKNDQSKLDSYSVGFGEYLTGREILQKIGTECFRDNINKDFWVRRLLERIDADSHRLHIIPDTRFPNEYDAIKAQGGYVIRVRRMGIPESDHISETALDNHAFDLLVDNNGGLKDPAMVWQINDFLININAY